MQTEAATVDMELVNSPKHYRSKSGREVIDVVEEFGFGGSWHLGDALVYLMRAGKKDPIEQDVAKAAYYLNRWLENDSGGSTFPSVGDDELPTAASVIDDFGLTGNVAIAVTYLLNWVIDAEDGEGPVEKALQALQSGV